MNGWDYEKACARYLLKNGFTNVKVTPGSGDFGCDIIAYKEKKKYGVQCKYYDEKAIGIKAIQEAIAGSFYYDCDYAMVITNVEFTNAAKELANKCDVILYSGIDAVAIAISEKDRGVQTIVPTIEELIEEQERKENAWLSEMDSNLQKELLLQIEKAVTIRDCNRLKGRVGKINDESIRADLENRIKEKEKRIKELEFINKNEDK